jgi:hypothetical protein
LGDRSKGKADVKKRLKSKDDPLQLKLRREGKVLHFAQSKLAGEWAF